MANTKSAAKRARQTIRRTAVNRRKLSLVKTQLKKARTAITGGKKDEAKPVLSASISALDKAVKTGQVHKNKANRLKSRLGKAFLALS